jgi:uncharacterized protein (TIGR02611 family)
MTDNAADLASDSPTEQQPAQNPERRPHGLRARVHRVFHAHPVLSLTTKIAVAVVGTLVTVVGVVMLVTPGPAFVLIPLGLAILATEFAFARRWLRWARHQAEKAQQRAAALDPAVRRRRLLLTGVLVLLVVGLVTAYVAVFDWPGFAVGGWNWLQSLADWVPELPGM